MSEKKAKFKPCPFCGSTDIAVEKTCVYWCRCQNCWSEAGAPHKTKKAAIAAWNTRRP